MGLGIKKSGCEFFRFPASLVTSLPGDNGGYMCMFYISIWILAVICPNPASADKGHC